MSNSLTLTRRITWLEQGRPWTQRINKLPQQRPRQVVAVAAEQVTVVQVSVGAAVVVVVALLQEGEVVVVAVVVPGVRNGSLLSARAAIADGFRG